MKRSFKRIITAALACAVTAGSAAGATAYCNEGVICYDNTDSCIINSNDSCVQAAVCEKSQGSLYDLLSSCTSNVSGTDLNKALEAALKSCENSNGACTELYRSGCNIDNEKLNDILNEYCKPICNTDSDLTPDSTCTEACPTEKEPEAQAPTSAPPDTGEEAEPSSPAVSETEAPDVQQPSDNAAEPEQQETVTTRDPDEAPTQPQTEAATLTTGQTEAPVNGYELNAYELEVVRLINEIRAQNGLSLLSINTELSRVARIKAQDMRDMGYFSHNSPTYGSPFDMMRSFGINYRTAGENIAMGYRTPQSVVDGWMNSDGHRRNILNASFTQIGMGYIENGSYWSQMFIG